MSRPPGTIPTGLPSTRHGAVWTTNETGGSETVIGAAGGAVRGTVELGGEVGNVAYDADRPDVGRGGRRRRTRLIDPAALSVSPRIPLRDCISRTA